LRLLVIEDEDRLSGILKSKLGEIGFTVDIAGSAADASAALELINYDAAILDLGLPDGDGLAVDIARSYNVSPATISRLTD
jgi:DNA-binding response OmpR family regulator